MMRRFTTNKKFLFGLAISLVLAMAIGSLALGEVPTSSQASGGLGSTATNDDGLTVTGGEDGVDYDYSSYVWNIHPQGDKEITIKNTNPDLSTATADRIKIGPADGGTMVDTVKITLAGVNIYTASGAAFEIADDADFNVIITLADGSENTLGTTRATAALKKNGGTGMLTITGSTGEDAGILNANGGTDGAGIGGEGSSTESTSGVSNITIAGGKIYATGGPWSAGIGGGQKESGSNITINAGTVVAKGGGSGAGIGGGYLKDGSSITINGGTVTAIGNKASGIGGGYRGNGSQITITGGRVTATGLDQYGAGIGGGNGRNGTDITISGGSVVATGGKYGAGIGGGYQGSGNNIIISGGSVTATGGEGGSGIGRGDLGVASSGNDITGDNVVVVAESGDTTENALEGFTNENRGIIFKKGKETSGNWSGVMYSSPVTVTADVKFPADLEVGTGKILTVGSGVNLTVADGAELTNNGNATVASGATVINEGTITNKSTLTCAGTIVNEKTIANSSTLTCTGTITTRTHFYLTSGDPYGTDDFYQTYNQGGNIQKYTGLPNPDDTTLLKNGLNSDKFLYWYYLDKDGKEVAIKDGDSGDDVLPNEHNFYEKRQESHSISTSKQGEGTITPNVSEAYSGDTVTFTVAPAAGYRLHDGSLSVKAGTTDVAFTDKGSGNYSFTMPDAAVVISAVFDGSYSISVDSSVSNGTITPNASTAFVGDTVTFTAVPNSGYRLAPVSVNVTKTSGGKAVPVTGSGSNYSFTMPGSDVVISATFLSDTDYMVVVDSSVSNGTITPSAEVASDGDTVTFTAVADDGYTLAAGSVAVATSPGGSPVTVAGSGEDYSFTMPGFDVIISAKFEGIPYSISIDSTEHGSITSDVTEAIVGDTVTLTAIPEDGYQLQEGSLTVKAGDTDIEVNENEDGKYTFTMPIGDVNVSAAFEQIPGPGPEPTPTPPTPTPPTPTPPEPTPTPEPTPDPSVVPDGDDSSSKTSDPFMCGIALAFLGAATTGAILKRKFR